MRKIIWASTKYTQNYKLINYESLNDFFLSELNEINRV